MVRTVTKINPQNPAIPKPKRVAGYARVSCDKDAMLHSLSAQVSYFSNLIQRHPGWEYVGVYADKGLTGTKANRPEFQRMLADARNGRIDMIITKSISRFARNTLTLLETARELKELGIDVYFEEQNIFSMSGDGELMLTVLASFAQEESLSTSENQKWRVKRNFQDGKPWNCTMLGYRNKNGHLIVVPEEAEVVKIIFREYLSGKGFVAISNHLNKLQIPTRLGGKWSKNGVVKVLQNEAYAGDLMLQKTYRENHLSKQPSINHGELPKYYVEDCHEAIIDPAMFEATQTEIKRRTEKYYNGDSGRRTYPFSGKIICGLCGKNYRRKINGIGSKYAHPVWICPTYNFCGKAACQSKQVPESILTEQAEALGQPFERVVVYPDNRLVFHSADGKKIERMWNY